MTSTVPRTQALPACLLRLQHRAWQAHCSLLGYEVSNLGYQNLFDSIRKMNEIAVFCELT